MPLTSGCNLQCPRNGPLHFLCTNNTCLVLNTSVSHPTLICRTINKQITNGSQITVASQNKPHDILFAHLLLKGIIHNSKAPAFTAMQKNVCNTEEKNYLAVPNPK